MEKKLEILAPAGNAECARAALHGGANAIYLGYDRFSARSSAENFAEDNLREIIAEAHFSGVKVYVAMNTLVKNAEVEDFLIALKTVWAAGADAIILQDIFLGKAIKRAYPEVTLHLSTQAGVCNENGALLAKSYGFSRVILARETPLTEIKKIAKIIETEVFVQGALCTCFSGQCYFSSFAGGESGNRGRCKQPCRKKYVYDRAGGDGEKRYALSLSDLCVGEDVFALAEAGVTSFKIEGRMRRKEYVAAAAEYYAKILSKKSEEEKNLALSDLKRAYNRGNYTKGLAFGQDKRFLSPYVQGHIGEKAGTVKVIGGKYFVESRFVPSAGDAFKILRDKKEAGGAFFVAADRRGFYISSKERLKNGDGVFITTDNASFRRVLSARKTLPIRLKIKMNAGEYGEVSDGKVTVKTAEVLPVATGRALEKSEIEACFEKTDGMPVEVSFDEVKTNGAFLPKSGLNAFRRAFYAALKKSRTEISRAGIDEEKFFSRYKARSHEAKRDNGGEKRVDRGTKIAVIARSFSAKDNDRGAEIAVWKPDDYGKIGEEIDAAFGDFRGEKYVYYPAYCRAETEEAIFTALQGEKEIGVYGENYAALQFANRACCALFAGTGFNLTNEFSVRELLQEGCVSRYALSKEISAEEQEKTVDGVCMSFDEADGEFEAKKTAFALSFGGIKLMDLCYCPFGKTCGVCDKRDVYSLTDENGRTFPVRRYKDACGECRFEVYNCAALIGKIGGDVGALIDLTTEDSCKKYEGIDYARLLRSEELQKSAAGKYTYGHSKTGVK